MIWTDASALSRLHVHRGGLQLYRRRRSRRRVRRLLELLSLSGVGSA